MKSFVSKIVNRNLRNTIAHLNFTISTDGKITGPGNEEINIDEEISAFWKRVGEITETYNEKGLMDFINEGEKPT